MPERSTIALPVGREKNLQAGKHLQAGVQSENDQPFLKIEL